jgi:hypothetical protein
VPLDEPLRVALHGQSVGTRMLVGSLEVWTGVRADIDWAAAPRARPERTPPPRRVRR